MKNGRKLDRGNRSGSFKNTFKKWFSLKDDAAPNDEIRDRLLSGGQITGTNMCVMVCAIVIASAGLNTDSVAVIIGAMLISPIMGTILAMAYGAASNDASLVSNYAAGFAFQVVASILTATVYFLLSPIKTATPQLIARTNPSFIDMIIAIAGGIAGIIGQTRADKSNNIIPGVAIATALMPPLCTCGYAIANGEWRMLGGAFYLFAINAFFIFFAGTVILVLLKTPKVNELTDAEWRKMRRKMIRNTLILIIPCAVAAASIYLS